MENKFKMKLPFMKNSRAAKASALAHSLRAGKDPYFDWTVILCLFIGAIVLCVSFALALWRNVNEGSINFSNTSVVSPSVATGVSLDVVDLKKVISTQSGKSSIATEYKSNYSGPADPSQ